MEKYENLSLHYTTACQTGAGLFVSSRLVEKDQKQGRQWTRGPQGKRSLKRSYLFLLAGIIGGLFFSCLRLGLQVFDYFQSQGNYCLVFEDNFDGPLNTSLWKHEVSVGGFGNKELEWTTASPNNSWVSQSL